MKKSTIYDVAKKANVSIATVSKVVNNKGQISEKTRNHIKEVMEEMDYEPSIIAKALSGKKTKTLGVIVPNIANPFFGEITRALENKAREIEYAIIICSTYNQSEREEEYINLLLKKQVDGIIIATEQLDSDVLKKINKRNTPVLKFSVYADPNETASVTTNNYEGGYIAARYLLEKGHHHVGIIGDLSRDSEQKRIQGFCNYFEVHQSAVQQSKIISCNSELAEAKMAAEQLLAFEPHPTALFATTDFFAIVAINAALEKGLKVPEDLSVIGFDNTIYAQLCQPQLTTIEQPVEEMAQLAIYQLLKIIEEEKCAPFEQIVLAPKLIERQSVKSYNQD
ncbi:substrate-binding domain-containing protein [Lysinibacillus capsici]|uniref:LacI family DNA-binding transcriptional regulator n=1 Tax=Lysinibacillus capsici TaxID=2115968 RepID=UPI0001DA4C45|nr:substrate-binding domain-containing protein [Lysinibacillus capsici]EFI66580.1 transcriptional regulator [Lysinibacillus fusiformis ZC1]EKU43817.1 transcriptional regulator [Lysinibacillus fusiformis ZB2]MBU5250869.1 substrate-binding domain-containing protein [Lysinibacillus capsici]MED4697731.1 substrate-binding domain-containing protein [Lysinibacillus capsici]